MVCIDEAFKQVHSAVEAVTGLLDGVQGGVESVVSACLPQSNKDLPPERIQATIRIVEHLEANQKKTMDVSAKLLLATTPMADAHEGLKNLLGGVLTADLSQAEKDKVAEAALEGEEAEEENAAEAKVSLPEIGSSKRKLLVAKLRAHARTFMHSAGKVNAEALNGIIRDIAELEAAWQALATEITDEIKALQVFKDKMQEKMKSLEKMKFWCKLAGGALVVGAVALTVGAALCTGGASLGAEVAVVGGVFVAGQAARRRCPENVAKAVSLMSPLTAAIEAAKGMVKGCDDSMEHNRRLQAHIDSMMQQLSALRKDCEEMATKCKVSGHHLVLCKGAWDSLLSKVVDRPSGTAALDEVTNDFLMEIVLQDRPQIEAMKDEVATFADKYTKMKKSFEDLSTSATEALQKHGKLREQVWELKDLVQKEQSCEKDMKTKLVQALLGTSASGSSDSKKV